MKLNKHVMALNLAAVIAFGAVAGIVAPAVAGDDAVVAYAATTDGDAKEAKKDEVTAGDAKGEVTGGEVKADETNPKAVKESKFVFNGDGATVTLTEVNKKAKKVKLPATVKADGKEYKITQIKKGAFKGSKATSIDLSALELEKLASKQFDGAKKVTTIKINGSKLTAKSINKNFVKGLKKLKKINVVAKKAQYKKLEKTLKTAAKKTGNKAGTKVKKVSK